MGSDLGRMFAAMLGFALIVLCILWFMLFGGPMLRRFVDEEASRRREGLPQVRPSDDLSPSGTGPRPGTVGSHAGG
jgi:hypothetical protein